MKKPKDIIIKGKTLQERLDLHKKWLKLEDGGVRLCLNDVNLHGIDLGGSDLRGACLKNVDLRYTNLQDANLKEAELDKTDLRYSILNGANLSHVDLMGNDLRKAHLKHTNLKSAHLHSADLRGSNLDFSQLNLSCNGLNFKIDEQLAKQFMYHVINLMQYSGLDVNKIVKKDMYKWLEDSHLVTKHKLPVLK